MTMCPAKRARLAGVVRAVAAAFGAVGSVASTTAPSSRVVLVALTLPVALTGCASGGATDTSSRTGGVSLVVDLRDVDAIKATYWTVSTEGAIGFGGGRDAMNRRVTWSGTMTDEEIAQLVELLRRDGWLAGTVTATGTPKNRITDVTVRGPDGRKHVDLRGQCDAADRLAELLMQSSTGRHQDFMKQLPLPSSNAREPS